MKRLEIGPGTAPLGNCDTLDCYDHHNPTYLVDLVRCDMWPIPSETYDEVISVHCFEHIELARIQAVFRNIHRILKTGGSLRVHVPNGPVIISAYIKFPNRRQDIQTCIYGAESQEMTKYDVAHKVLYDNHLLMSQFHKNSFKDVREITQDPMYTDRHDPYWEWMSDEDRFSLKMIGYK